MHGVLLNTKPSSVSNKSTGAWKVSAIHLIETTPFDTTPKSYFSDLPIKLTFFPLSVKSHIFSIHWNSMVSFVIHSFSITFFFVCCPKVDRFEILSIKFLSFSLTLRLSCTFRIYCLDYKYLQQDITASCQHFRVFSFSTYNTNHLKSFKFIAFLAFGQHTDTHNRTHNT